MQETATHRKVRPARPRSTAVPQGSWSRTTNNSSSRTHRPGVRVKATGRERAKTPNPPTTPPSQTTTHHHDGHIHIPPPGTYPLFHTQNPCTTPINPPQTLPPNHIYNPGLVCCVVCAGVLGLGVWVWCWCWWGLSAVVRGGCRGCAGAYGPGGSPVAWCATVPPLWLGCVVWLVVGCGLGVGCQVPHLRPRLWVLRPAHRRP